MKKLLLLFVCCLPFVAHAQTCSPFMGISNVQFLDNLGQPLTNGALYSFQSGTSTQQATFSDPACTIPNTNPITFTTGGRAIIWLVTANVYKFVLCSSSTDGPACAAGDTLAVADQVPGGVTGGGGGGGAPFISSSANPATTGVLRCASGDSCVAFRNTANSANLVFSKDVNDLLTWSGGSIKLPQVGAPGSVAGFDILYADSTANRLKQCSNGAACAQLANTGVDISTSDGVTALHFGATQETLSSTAPTTGQFLQFNGTNIVGVNPAVANADATAQAANIATTTLYAVPASSAGTYRFSCVAVVTQAATTSSTLPQCTAAWTDKDSGVAESVIITGANTSNTVGTIGIGGATGFGGVITIQAKASTNISYSTANYASSGATPMQFAIHVKAEFIGP